MSESEEEGMILRISAGTQSDAERQELREWLDGYDPALEKEWVGIAQERINQINTGVPPLDGDKVVGELRQLAKQLVNQ